MSMQEIFVSNLVRKSIVDVDVFFLNLISWLWIAQYKTQSMPHAYPYDGKPIDQNRWDYLRFYTIAQKTIYDYWDERKESSVR